MDKSYVSFPDLSPITRGVKWSICKLLCSLGGHYALIMPEYCHFFRATGIVHLVGSAHLSEFVWWVVICESWR